MYEIYRDWDSAKVGLIENILKDAGIPTLLRNWTGSNITEIPIPAIYPNVCVLNRGDVERARQLVGDYLNAVPDDAPEWRCPHCGATNDGFLPECWSCRAAKDDAS